MKHTVTFLITLLFAGFVFAQPAIEWQKTFGGASYDEARCIQQTMDGGYIVAGFSYSMDGDLPLNQGGADVWVMKLDINGAIEWSTTFGGSKDEEPHAIKQTPDGGYIIAGQTDSEDEMMYGNHGQVDAWVIKMDSLGSVEWKRILGGSKWDIAWDVLLTGDNGFLVVGKSESSDGDVTENRGGPDYWVVKLNSIGLKEWQKTYGGGSVDIAYSGCNTNDGGFIIAGSSSSQNGDITAYHGGDDFWVLKLNASGEVEWQKSLGGNMTDSPTAIRQSSDGGYIVAGYTVSNNGDVTDYHGGTDFWVVKLTPPGEIQWQKALGGSGSDLANTVVETPGGGFVLSGSTNSVNGNVQGGTGTKDVWTLELNQMGDLLWQKTFGGTKSESCFDIRKTIDDGLIMAGFTFSLDGDVTDTHGQSDFWVIKLSAESVDINEIPEGTGSSQAQVYPNPASRFITLKTGLNHSNLEVFVTDMSGREISRNGIQDGENLDVSTLPNGMYVLRVITDTGKVYVASVVKQD